MEHIDKTLESLEHRHHIIGELWREAIEEQALHIENYGFENPKIEDKINLLGNELDALEKADYWLTIASGWMAGIK